MTKPDTEYSERRRPTAPVVTVDERETERRPRDQERERPQRPDDHPLDVAVSRGMVRVNMRLSIVAAISASLSAGATYLVSYIAGLNEDKQERAATMVEIRAVREQFDTHELRIAEIVKGNEEATKQRETAMIRIAQMQLLEWQYLDKVVAALKARKPVPDKSSVLTEAEARVETALRDGR